MFFIQKQFVPVNVKKPPMVSPKTRCPSRLCCYNLSDKTQTSAWGCRVFYWVRTWTNVFMKLHIFSFYQILSTFKSLIMCLWLHLKSLWSRVDPFKTKLIEIIIRDAIGIKVLSICQTNIVLIPFRFVLDTWDNIGVN